MLPSELRCQIRSSSGEHIRQQLDQIPRDVGIAPRISRFGDLPRSLARVGVLTLDLTKPEARAVIGTVAINKTWKEG